MTTAPFMTPGAGPVRARIEKRCAASWCGCRTLPRVRPAGRRRRAVLRAACSSPGVIGCVLLLLVVALMSLLTYLAWPSRDARAAGGPGTDPARDRRCSR